MTGQGHWFVFAVLLVASSPVIALWLTGWLADRRYIVEQRHARCRLTGNQLVDLTVVREAQSGTAIGIRSCSAQPNPELVRCARPCLPMFAH